MRIRIPGLLPVPFIAVAMVLSCLSEEPQERDLEARSGVHHVMIGHSPNCVCCRRFDVAKKPMTSDQAEWIERLTQERIQRLKALGQLPVHPSNRPVAKRAR